MSYLLVGSSSIIIKKISDILKDNNINDNSVSKYDMQDDNIFDVLYDINSFNLFGGKKAVICNNIDLVLENEEFSNYLNNQNDNVLIMTSLKVDDRKKMIKKIKETSSVIDLSNIDLTSFIKESFKDYKIDQKAIVLLKEYCNNDYLKIVSEIEKLKLYRIDTKEILYDDVVKFVRKSLDISIFDLTNAINKKDYKKIFDVYNDLILNGNDEIMIFSVLANNFRSILKIKLLCMRYSNDEIVKMLKMHPYRFKMLKSDSLLYDENLLMKYLKTLSDLDIQIKSGEIDKKTAMEIFLTKI